MRSALHIAKIQTQLLHESAYNHMQSFRFQGYFLVLVGVDAEMSYLAWGLVTPETYGRGTTPQENAPYNHMNELDSNGQPRILITVLSEIARLKLKLKTN